MRKISFSSFFLMMTVMSCVNEESNPDASFVLSSEEVIVGQQLTITRTGSSEFFIVYTGDEGSVFEEPGSVGIPSNSRGVIFYSYSKEGNYTITGVASDYNEDEGSSFDVFERSITVIDTARAISSIRINTTLEHGFRNREGATSQTFTFLSAIEGQENYAVPIYHFSRFIARNEEGGPALTSISDLDLSTTISATSESTRITIDNEVFEGGLSEEIIQYFNFQNRYVPKEIELRPASGSPKTILICPIIIPEFQSVRAGTSPVTSVNVHPFDFFKFYGAVPIPFGTDASSITLNYENYYPADTEIETINGPLGASGVTVDLTDTTAFMFTYEQPGFEEIFTAEATTYLKAVEIPEFTSFSINGVNGTISLEPNSDGKSYLVDIELPEGTSPTELSSLIAEFEANFIEDVTIRASTGDHGPTGNAQDRGLQTSGVTSLNFSSYNTQLSNGSFRPDDFRVQYKIRHLDSAAEAKLPNGVSNVFFVEIVYKIGVTIAGS